MGNAESRYQTQLYLVTVFTAVGIAYVAGCGASTSPKPPGDTIALALSSSMALAPQDGTPVQVGATITRGSGATGNVALAAGNLPSGMTATFQQPGTGNSGNVSLQAASTVPAGNYTVTISASDGSASSSQNLAVVVAIAATVGSGVDTTQGVNGKLNQFMSTSFQPAEWDYQFFQDHTANEPAQLNNLGPQHIRIQGVSEAVPMKAHTGSASDWDFSKLDAIVQPVLGVGDHSPEFQIAVAPPFLNDPVSGHFVFTDANVQAFADYSANLVRYYNKGGFTWGASQTKFVSPSYPQHTITWWGIFNEYNINGMTPSQYIQLYDTVVPAMLTVDNTIKISAMELSVANPTVDLPPFVAPAASGGVNAQVNVVSTHFYPTCQQADLDTTLFGRVPQMVEYMNYVYQELRTRTDLQNVPIWVTENNVNADYSSADGSSNCDPSHRFVLDPRGTDAFFAGWRPYVFSQLGKAGSQALYHWDYDADAQFGEVDYGSDAKYLSYWVDYWLARMFPAPPGGDILNLSITETTTTETIAVRFSDGSVVMMVADIAVHSSGDNNGTGDPRTTVVDISALGNFSSATQLTIDKNTDVVNGPTPTPVTVAPKLSLTLGGYGVTFITLKP